MKEFKRLLIDLILGKDAIVIGIDAGLDNTDKTVRFNVVMPVVIPKGKFRIEPIKK